MTAALELIRQDEQDALAALPPQPSDSQTAYTEIVVTREFYRLIEKLPTRHKVYVIRTYWRPDPWQARCHVVYVSERGKLRIVVPKRDGEFGGAR